MSIFTIILQGFARLALLLVWILTPLVNRAFHGGWLLPLLGIIFLPFTTLIYVLVYTPGSGVTGWGWLWVALALARHSPASWRSLPDTFFRSEKA